MNPRTSQVFLVAAREEILLAARHFETSVTSTSLSSQKKETAVIPTLALFLGNNTCRIIQNLLP